MRLSLIVAALLWFVITSSLQDETRAFGSKEKQMEFTISMVDDR